jgi:hypothetical protein
VLPGRLPASVVGVEQDALWQRVLGGDGPGPRLPMPLQLTHGTPLLLLQVSAEPLSRASLLVPLCSCLSVVPLCSCLSVSAVPHLLQVVASTFGGGSRMRVGYCVAIMLVCVLDFVMAMLLALFGGWRAPDLNPDPDHWP